MCVPYTLDTFQNLQWTNCIAVHGSRGGGGGVVLNKQTIADTVWLWSSACTRWKAEDTKHCDINCDLRAVLAVCVSVQSPATADRITERLWHRAELIQVPNISTFTHFIFHTWWLCLCSLVLHIHQLPARGGNKWLCHCREEIVCRKKNPNTHNLIVFALWPGLPEKKSCVQGHRGEEPGSIPAVQNPPTPTLHPPEPTPAPQSWSSPGNTMLPPHLQGCKAYTSNFRHARTLIRRTCHLRNHPQFGLSSY